MRLAKHTVAVALVAAGLAVPATSAEAGRQDAAVLAPRPATDASLLAEMKDEAQGLVVTGRRAATAKLRFVRVRPNGDLLPSLRGDSEELAAGKAQRYLDEFGSTFGAAPGELNLVRTEADEFDGYTFTYTQSYRGLPVFGSMIRANVDADGDLTSVNGYAAPDLDLGTDPQKSASEAGDRAVAFVKDSPPESEDGETADVREVTAAAPELLVYRTGAIKGESGTNVLAYAVEVGDGAAIREQVFVDAESGKPLNRYSLVDTAIDREVYESSASPLDRVWSEGDPLPWHPDDRPAEPGAGGG